MVELARHPNIVGIKEASGDIGQISRIIEGTLDEDFQVISGDDNLTFPILALGGSGVISVAANVEPGRMVAMFEAFCEGDFETALDLHYELAPLFRSMFIDTNPIPVKKAVELRGMAAGPVRLPLDELDSEKTARLREALSAMIKVEYLADASAVRYTRYPEGLPSALDKIMKVNSGKMDVDEAVSHLFFADPTHSPLDHLYATHPPIEDRIKRLREM